MHNDLASEQLKEVRTNVFAIHMPQTERFKMEMALLHKDNTPNSDATYLNFVELKIAAIIPGFEDLKLFKLQLTTYQEIKEDGIVTYIKDSMGNFKQIDEYKIRTVNDVGFDSRYYYELHGSPRPIPTGPISFIFNLFIAKNEEYLVYRDPQSKSIFKFLEQTFCFIVALIETGHFDTLSEFIVQHEKCFKPYGAIEKEQFIKFYKYLQKYVENKNTPSHPMRYETLFALTCLFGLLPDSESTIFSFKTIHNTEIILKMHEKHIDKLQTLDLSSHTSETFIKGLALISVIEEYTQTSSNWIYLLKLTASNQELVNTIISKFFDYALKLKINVQWTSFQQLQGIIEDMLLVYPNCLGLASSIYDFIKLTKGLTSNAIKEVDTPITPSLSKGDGNSTILDEQSLLEAIRETIFSNKESSNCHEKVLDIVKEHIRNILQAYIENFPDLTKEIPLRTIADFMRELAEDSDYLTSIFGLNKQLCENICHSVKEALYHDEESLQALYEIVIKYYNEFLLFQINIPLLFKHILNPLMYQYRTSDFYLAFFSSCMVKAKLSFEEFNSILSSFLKNFDTSNKLIENLDFLYNLFNKDDESTLQKKQAVIYQIFSKMKPGLLGDNIAFVLQHVKNPKILDYYRPIATQEIKAKHLAYITTRNCNNPLIILQNLSKSFPKNSLIKELISFSIAQVPSFNREAVLVSLFKEPSHQTLLYMVLTEEVFKGSNIFKELHKICCSIIDDLQTSDIELKWIFFTYKLSQDLVIEQFNIIIEENKLTNKNSKEKLDIGLLLKNYKKAWEEKIHKIDNLAEFISTFCPDASDAREYIDTLKRIWVNQHEKKLSDIISPAELDIFLPYIEKLKPFVKSASFLSFRQKAREGTKTLSCKEEADKILNILNDFQENINTLLSSPETTLLEMSEFFSPVKDTKKEIEILIDLVNNDKKEYFTKILKYLKDAWNIKKICKGISACMRIFKLTCKFDKLIEDGCKLSTEDKISFFYEISTVVKESFGFKKNKPFYEIIQEFESGQELLEFTIARTNKSEIDFMVEAVNDYDESHISTQTIFDFMNFWTFIMDLKTNSSEKSLELFLEDMRTLCQDKQFMDIVQNLKTSKKNFYGIQNIYLELNHKEEAKRKQIFKIIDHSTLRIIEKNKKFDIEIQCIIKISDKESIQNFKSSDIFELRDRAHLIVFTEQNKTRNKERQNYQKEELDKFKSFCSLADVIDQILKTLNKLNFNGYPELMKVQAEGCNTSIVDTEFTCHKNQFESLQRFKQQLTDILEEWSSSVIDAYKKHYELTYLKGKDFWKVEHALISPESERSHKGLFLLDYIGKQSIKSELDTHQTPEQRLNAIGETLKNLPNKIESLAPLNLPGNFMFYITEVNEKATIKGLVSLYGKSVPASSQILVCHNSTSWSELVAFSFRCFFDPQQKLFCLIRPERLSFSLQDQVLSLMKDLNKLYPEQIFKLGFVTMNMSTHLVNSLKVKNQAKILKSFDLIEPQELKNLIKKQARNCVVVTSSITGLGKTTWIQNQAAKQNLKCIKIPISGVVSPIEIGKRLLPVLTQTNSAFWFTIGSIEDHDKSLLNEILFSLIVLRSFHNSKNVIKIPEDLHIYIELDSSCFGNLKDDIEIFNYLSNEHIEQMIWEDLNHLSPKIQFVCHYLEALADKSLGKVDLLEENLVKKLPQTSCIKLLIQRFLEMPDQQDKSFASYTQLTIFVDVLYSLFKSFSESGFFLYSILSRNSELNNPSKAHSAHITHQNTPLTKFTRSLSSLVSNMTEGLLGSKFMPEEVIKDMRLSLGEALVLAASQFTSKSVQSVRACQKESIGIAKEQIASDNNEIIGKAIVSWDNFNPFVVVFTADQTPIFIYKDLEHVPKPVKKSIQSQIDALGSANAKNEKSLVEYKNCSQIDLFERLVSLTNQFYLSNVCLKCFRKYDRTDQVCAFCRSKLLENKDNIKEFVRDIAIESARDYVLTLDNFIKMVLIFIRVQQKIPVIIMGETGCGKTSLIRYLCTRILGDEFRSFTIHAGINDKMILTEMNKFIKEAEELKFDRKSIWIFFDEFNTSESIGFIKEIICERTMLGRKLPENMIFLGACNPWRLKTQRIIFDENVGIKKKLFNRANNGYKLLYTVFPLPESMIDFVWDYGYLDSETEKKYVEAIFSSLEIEECGNLKMIMTELVCAAHNKLKKWEDVSSVSLRDVSRYKILFNWLFNSLSERDRLSTSTAEKKSKLVLYQQAAVLALLHCYYLRISSRKKRSQFIMSLEQYFMKLPMTGRQVEKLLYEEEMEFLRRMEPLPGGIAKNQALRENVLALIVCIFTKTPVFICGKPGCSKSLAIQLVFDHLRGKDSNDPYFKTLPELIHVSYQGSEYCTSESILGVFTRAEKYLTVTTKDKEILPVIVFDEIGLAEISENNPLKILHHKLEIENTNKVSFVGISNWRLDASKMNRALYLARPDPDIEDLIFTAEAISKSIGENVNLNPNVISALATIYCNLRGYVLDQGKENVFGLRDYYFLIKGIIYDLNSESAKSSENAEERLYYIIKKNIKRNFGCLENEGDFFWEQFCQYMNKSEKIMQVPEVSAHELIFNNLKTKNTRYLMLITQDDCVTEYIEEIIRRQNDNPKLEQLESMRISDSLLIPQKENDKTQNIIKTLIGSQMIDDTKNESYGYKVLSDIILYLEKGYTLILKKMDHLYSSLYDLFNQSFVWSGDKKYCRVALGALYNPKCLVHEDFHCIVFITEEEMKRADPPFLNRFEKYRLNIEDILTPSEQILHKELIKWVDSLTTCNGKHDLIRPNLIFVNYSSEYIFSLILKARTHIEENNEQYSEERVIEICKQEFIETATADFPVVISLNVEDQGNRQKLLDLYYNKKQRKFKDLCEKVLSSTSQQKNVVYTYTQISEDIVYPDDKSVKELKLSSFRSEDELSCEIKQCTNSEYSLLVIRVEFSSENCHLPLLKHLLLNSINESKDIKELHFMIIIHLKRFDVSTRKVQIETLFQGWNSVMLDNLNLEYVIPNQYIDTPSFKKLISLNLIPSLEEVLEDAFDKSLARIRYNVPPEDQNKVNTRRKDIREKLRDKSSKLLTLIKTKLVETINQNRMVRGFDDWRKYILGNEWIKITAVSLFEAIGLAVTKYYESYLMKILYILEKNCLLDSFFEAESAENKNEYLLQLWESNFKKIDINMNERLDDQLISLDFTFGLSFPFSTYEYNRIKQIQLEAEDLANQHEEALTGRLSFEKLTESSFFEEKFNEISAQEDLFEKYFRDQLLLYNINNKLNLNVEIASSVLERMFLKNKKERFEYFLSKSKQLFLILGALEAILTLEKEDLNFYEDLSKLYNLDKENIDNIEKKDLPENALIYKGGLYYSLTKDEIIEIKEDKLGFETMTPDNDKYNHNPFLDYLFKNAIRKISSCSYILKFKCLKNVKSAFRLVEEKIIKSGIIPQNIEAFRPWIDLMQFIENCEQNPSQSFESLVIWLQNLEQEGIFSSSKALTQLINYLSEKTNFIGDQTENQTRFFKLQTQLYKNLVSYDSLRLDDALSLIDFDSQLWKTSVKIIDLLDYETNFSSAINQCDGNLIECEDDPGLAKLKIIVKNVSSKITQMLSNKAFSIIRDEWKNSYKDLLVQKFEYFQSNITSLKEDLEVESEADKTKDIFILGKLIWLKIYLYFYAIALENNEHDIEVLGDIDEMLGEDASQHFIAKVYVLKVLKFKNDKSLHELRRAFMHKNINWMKPLLKEDLKKSQIANVVSLLPLYTDQQRSLFKKVDDLLCQIYSLDHEKVPEFLELCKKSQEDYLLSMCIYSWFIKLYTKYLEKDFYINETFFSLMRKHKDEISENLGPLGCEFIFSLLKNFKHDSFFYLDGSLKEEEISQKLAVLGVITSFIAQQFLESTFSTIFFENKHFQFNLSPHFAKRCLFGLSESNFIINNMKDVKDNVERRLKQNRIYSDAKYIYKCGSDCDYLFYFENCGRPNDRSLCPVCKRDIGATLKGETLALRSSGPQQEIMSIEVGFAYIDERISKFQESAKLGYIINLPQDNAILDTKLGLNSLTYRFLHFILHSALFGLYEAEFISPNEICNILNFDSPIRAREYLMDHFLQDYDMISKQLAHTECNFWIYNKLLNLKKLFPYKNCLTDGNKLKDFEKLFEREVMINEPITDLNHEYLQAYNTFANTRNDEDFTVYLDETNVPTEKYPLLESFNYIEFPTFDGFKQQFSIGIGNDKRYPLLKYFLDRHEELSNISALPAIVEFTNQLRKNYNYRISRDKATSTVLKDLLDKDSLLKELFAQFENQWNRLHIQIVRVGCQEKVFKKITAEDSLSIFLPNIQKDESGILMVGTMTALADLQNELIYQVKKIGNPNQTLEEIIEEEKPSMGVIQMIKKDDVIDISKEKVLQVINENGYIHNYEYGKGKHIIYDFEEIEAKLYQFINKKKVLNTEKFLYMNYQFELYPESTSIITDIRKKIPQILLNSDKKALYKTSLKQMSNKDLIEYLGSLDYMFTYLCNVKEDANQTVEDFCKSPILINVRLHENMREKPPLSKVQLKYIIDLYETVEEVVFDQALQFVIRSEFVQGIPEDERMKVIEMFEQATLKSAQAIMYSWLRDANVLVKVLKRLILRILTAQTNLENRLLEYFAREDIWSQDININDIYNVELNDEIKLKHAYVILRHLESQVNSINKKPTEQKSPLMDINEQNNSRIERGSAIERRPPQPKKSIVKAVRRIL